MIKEVEESNKTFIPHADIPAFIKTIQTPWATFGKDEVLIQLRIYKSIRRYFLLKDYLPSQKLIKTYDNGDILVNYRVSNLREIEELIIKWLPNIEIIEPRHLKKKIQKRLQHKMDALSRPLTLP